MTQHETSGPTLEMHLCEIERVYKTGLIDARSERAGKSFTRINVAATGVDGTFSLGDKCIVLTDGAQKFAVSGLRPIDINDANEETIHLFHDDLVDWNNARSIGAKDEYGNMARMVVSPGGGVIMDAGEWCMGHYSPGMRKFIQYLERREIIMPGHHQKLEHDGKNTRAQYRWHTEVDDDATDRVLAHKDPDAKGHTLTVNIEHDGDNVTTVYLSEDGEERLSIEMADDGAMTVRSQSDVWVEAENSRVDIIAPNEVYLGEKNGNGKYVALEPEVKREIKAVITDYLAHQHSYVVPLIPIAAAPTTPLSVGTALQPDGIPLNSPAPQRPLDMASKTVKADSKP